MDGPFGYGIISKTDLQLKCIYKYIFFMTDIGSNFYITQVVAMSHGVCMLAMDMSRCYYLTILTIHETNNEIATNYVYRMYLNTNVRNTVKCYLKPRLRTPRKIIDPYGPKRVGRQDWNDFAAARCLPRQTGFPVVVKVINW